MPISHRFVRKELEEKDCSEMEDFSSEDLDSENSEYDPTYDDDDADDDLDMAQNKLSKLSITRKPKSRSGFLIPRNRLIL